MLISSSVIKILSFNYFPLWISCHTICALLICISRLN